MNNQVHGCFVPERQSPLPKDQNNGNLSQKSGPKMSGSTSHLPLHRLLNTLWLHFVIVKGEQQGLRHQANIKSAWLACVQSGWLYITGFQGQSEERTCGKLWELWMEWLLLGAISPLPSSNYSGYYRLLLNPIHLLPPPLPPSTPLLKPPNFAEELASHICRIRLQSV